MRLLQQLLHRHRDVRAADERNGAVAAAPVAPLRNLEVGVVARRGQVTLGGQLLPLGGAQRAGDARPVAGAEEVVDLGQLGPQLVGVALREAADDEEPLDFARLLGRRRTEYHVDGLLLGVADESAGVDDHDLGVGPVAVEDHFVARRLEAGHQMFAVNRIFRTAERDDVDFAHRCFSRIEVCMPACRPGAILRVRPASRRRTARRRTRGGRRCAAGRCPRRCRCSAPGCGTGR